MTIPARKENGDPDFKTDEILVSESTFNSKQQIPELLAFLKREQASGTLTLNINRGGITRIGFTQKEPVDIIAKS